MTEAEEELRAEIVRFGKSLFERGYTVGSSGNISVRLDERYLVTPTNSCMGFLDPERLSLVGANGEHLGGDKPTKELPMHFAMYRSRPAARAVVHLHSTYATLISCRMDTDPADTLAPITPYAVMRLGRVPMVPYTRPGSDALIPLLEAVAGDHPAVLLANHGPVVSGASLSTAVFAAEELEETAKLLVLSHGQPCRLLSATEIDDLNATFQLRD